jgi:hypothetical protein
MKSERICCLPVPRTGHSHPKCLGFANPYSHDAHPAAIAVSSGLDANRAVLYLDLVIASLSEAARKALQSMDPAKYEYQSEFARRYVAEGEAKGMAKGIAEGRAQLLLRLLTRRFGTLPAEVEERVRDTSIDELDACAERLLTAKSLDEVFASE